MSSRSATVLVIFVIACIAFCLASVFGAMTGQISILPNENDTGSILDNLSAITDSDGNHQSYGSQDLNDYSPLQSDDSKNSEPEVETTTDDSSHQQSDDSNNNPKSTDDDKSSEGTEESNVKPTNG